MFGTTKLGLWVGGAALAVTAVGAAGCGGSAASDAREDAVASSGAPTPSESGRGTASPGPYEYQLRSFGDDRMSFSLRLGPGEKVDTRPAAATSGSPSQDAPLRLVLEKDDEIVADITAHPADAPLPYRNTGLGNGRPGVYRTTADIPAEEAAAATQVRTALGDATVFTHPYYECTNSCKHWTVPVAVVTLSAPTDPRFPTLVIASNHAEIDVAYLRGILGRLAA